jgi:hypothetical protein
VDGADERRRTCRGDKAEDREAAAAAAAAAVVAEEVAVPVDRAAGWARAASVSVRSAASVSRTGRECRASRKDVRSVVWLSSAKARRTTSRSSNVRLGKATENMWWHGHRAGREGRLHSCREEIEPDRMEQGR